MGTPGLREIAVPAKPETQKAAPRPERRAGLIRSRAARRVLLATAVTGLVLAINQLDAIVEGGRWLVLAWVAPLSFLVALALAIVSWRPGGRRGSTPRKGGTDGRCLNCGRACCEAPGVEPVAWRLVTTGRGLPGRDCGVHASSTPKCTRCGGRLYAPDTFGVASATPPWRSPDSGAEPLAERGAIVA